MCMKIKIYDEMLGNREKLGGGLEHYERLVMDESDDAEADIFLQLAVIGRLVWN
jgi:hypothetical protein